MHEEAKGIYGETQGGTILNTSIILLFYFTYFTLYSQSPDRIIRYYLDISTHPPNVTQVPNLGSDST